MSFSAMPRSRRRTGTTPPQIVNWLGRLACLATLALGMTTSPNVGAQEVGTATSLPSLNERMLVDARDPQNRPTLTVGTYDLTRGFLAIYQSAEGRRVLFKSKIAPNGNISASASYYDRTTGRVVDLIQPVAKPNTGDIEVRVAGVDLVTFLLEGQAKGKFDPIRQSTLRTLLRGEAGQALLEGISALYLQLDRYEHNQEVAKLKTPFGLVRTALELSTGHYIGLDNTEQLSAPAKFEELRGPCKSGQCLIRSNQFVIHRSGLFDTITALAAPIRTSNADCESPRAARLSAQRSVVIAEVPASTDNCVGYCGPGCFTPGNIITPECIGHDNCVSQFSHLECIFTRPEGCQYPCNSLIEAIASYLRALFGRIEQ